MADATAFDSIQALPDAAAALFEGAAFQSGVPWWRCVEAAALPHGSRPRYVLVLEAGRPLALLPLLADAQGGLSSLCAPYTVTWQPLLLAGADPALIARVGRALGRWARGWPVLRLDAVDPDWCGLAPLLAGMRRGGFLAARFEHFGNWQESVAGIGWPDYLAARPGALRETVRRKQARIDRDPALQLECIRTPEAAAAGIAAYQDVYRRSWKVPEPFAHFDATLLAAAAAAGALRLGLLRHAGEPVAAQYWIVESGHAAVLKLAHDEAHRALSPGTVLTAWMIRGLFDEGVHTLDFGRGDDPYKQLWTTRRHRRIGLILAQPLHPRGAAALGRQWLGAAIRKVRTRSAPSAIGAESAPSAIGAESAPSAIGAAAIRP